MLRVNDCHLKLQEDEKQLKKVIARKLNTKDDFTYDIVRRSLDARKSEVFYSYNVDVTIRNESKYLHRKDVTLSKTKHFMPEEYASFATRPIVIGLGPSGLFCALLLARCGAKPIVYERGSCVEKRVQDVETFFNTGNLNETSNIQFGEGGAGTFSDGKLTSRSKDLRNLYVLEEFVRFGAQKDILYDALPHIGTDKLREIVKKMRLEIIRLGGEVHFESQLMDIRLDQNRITQIQINQDWIDCSDLLMGIGHSARDTFRMLVERKVCCESKNFSVGVRVEHPQLMIDENQYGDAAHLLPHASYRLTHQCTNGKGVYTFCMCPGGEVVVASSTKGRLVVNGMSEYKRDKANANSAVLVQVNASDYGKGLLDGVRYQENLEKKAFELGKSSYRAPAQNVSDYLNHRKSIKTGIQTSVRLGVELCDLHELFSDEVNFALEEGLKAFDNKLKGFAGEQALMIGVESRSTSPLRFLRNEQCQSLNVENLYPMGEGAGYAGGIVSAAIDGIRCAEEWMKKRGIK